MTSCPWKKVKYNKSGLSPGKTEIKTAGQDGRSIKVVRTVKSKEGKVIHKDTFISIWKMIPNEIYVGIGTTTTMSESTTTTKNGTTTTSKAGATTTTKTTTKDTSTTVFSG